MSKAKYYIGNISLYKYCVQNKISYNKIVLIINTYCVSPDEALHFTKQKGLTKLLKKYGIDKNNPDWWTYYRRLRKGWDIEQAIKVPKFPRGGDWRKKQLDISKYMSYNPSRND